MSLHGKLATDLAHPLRLLMLMLTPGVMKHLAFEYYYYSPSEYLVVGAKRWDRLCARLLLLSFTCLGYCQ